MLKVQTKATKRACSERRTGTTADIHLQSHPSAGTGRKRKQLVQAKRKTRTDKLASPQRGLLCGLLLNKWIKFWLQQCAHRGAGNAGDGHARGQFRNQGDPDPRSHHPQHNQTTWEAFSNLDDSTKISPRRPGSTSNGSQRPALSFHPRMMPLARS